MTFWKNICPTSGLLCKLLEDLLLNPLKKLCNNVGVPSLIQITCSWMFSYHCCLCLCLLKSCLASAKEKHIKNYEVLFQKVDIFPILRLSIQETPENIEGSFCVFLMIKNSEQKSRRMFLLNISWWHLQHYLWYCVFYTFNTQMSFSNRRIIVTVRFN